MNTLVISLGEFLFYVFWTTIQVLKVLDMPSDNIIVRILTLGAIVLLAYKIVFDEHTLLQICIVAALGLFGVVLFLHIGKDGGLLTFLTILGLKGIDIKKLMKYTFWCRLLSMATMFILLMLGLKTDVVVYHERSAGIDVRHSLGYNHPNFLHVHCCVLIILFICIYYEKLKWYHYLLLSGANIAVYFIAYSRTSTIIAFVVIFITIMARSGRLKKMWDFCAVAAMPGLFTLCTVYAVFYDNISWARDLDKRFQWRFLYSSIYYKDYPISLLGNNINDNTLVLDSGYTELVVNYGLIFTALYLVCFTVLTVRFVKQNRRQDIICILGFAGYAITEAFIPNVVSNISLLFMGELLYREALLEEHTPRVTEKHSDVPGGGRMVEEIGINDSGNDVNTPLFSVIMPVYNAERYLERAVSSVLSQTLKDLELLAVDDGSTDGSLDLLQQLAEHDGRLRVIHKKNEGVSAARNCALNAAGGKYVAFVDADDYMEPDMLETLLSYCRQKNSEAVMCRFFRDFSGECLPCGQLPWKDRQVLSGREIKQALIPSFFGVKNVGGFTEVPLGTVWRFAMTRGLVAGHRFDPELKMAEDLKFCVEVLSEAKSLSYCDKLLYHYVRYSDTAVEKYIKNKLETGLKRNDMMKRVLIKAGCFEHAQAAWKSSRLVAYTESISNCFKKGAPDKRQKKREIDNIVRRFNQDSQLNGIDFCYVSRGRKATYYMLRLKMAKLLYIIYRHKESCRQERLIG